MKRETTAEGTTVEEALDAALADLGVQQDAVQYEVVEEAGKRLFGLGSERRAQVRVWLREEFVAELNTREGDDTPISEDAAAGAPPDPGQPGAVPPGGFPTVALEELSDEDLDRIADEAVSTIQSVLDGFGIEATIEEYEGDEGEIILDIVGADLGLLIGRHGRTLDALQVLVAAITNRRLGFRYPVLVDVEGYRNRRRVKLEEIGQRAADRAVRQNGPVKLRPMSALERRVVHVALRDDQRVVTASEGEEPFRSVVVSPRRR
ncbi:MAG: RNA-binding cell elongation regulator Jag/EloR [Anaerosomatales bacterium]|nr:Jag N-terminal domain-containing protein [Anaerosomatales bacterium]MDT8433724.1 RNA-binding cell elongation regulator Jag/EloR [Anaerosomatales bacterium]